MKKFIIFLTLTLILISVYFNFDDEPTKFVNDIVEEGDINVYFCPGENCFYSYLKEIKNSQRVYCAFYDINHNELISLLKSKGNVKLYVDEYEDVRNLDFVKKDDKSALSHNKFCVFDRKILWTGSFNPTFNGAYKNNNNIIVIESLNLANNYELEFEELWNYNFGKGRETVEPIVYLNEKKYASYFCPEDNCKYKVVEELKLSEKSIYFMVFSFTDFDIADLLIVKNKEVEIKGVLESKRVNMQYNQYKKLVENDVNVRKDSNSFIMHHKVFIIDNNTVITGSYNPTKAGNTKNDENILIIKDKKVVSRYLKEFESVFVSSLE